MWRGYIDLKMLVLLALIIVAQYLSNKREKERLVLLEVQIKIIRKMVYNQELIAQRLGLYVGTSLEKIIKKVDLDSAGN